MIIRLFVVNILSCLLQVCSLENYNPRNGVETTSFTDKVSLVCQFPVNDSLWSAAFSDFYHLSVGEMIIISTADRTRFDPKTRNHRNAAPPTAIKLVSSANQSYSGMLASILEESEFSRILIMNSLVHLLEPSFVSEHSLDGGNFYWHPTGLLYSAKSALSEVIPFVDKWSSNNFQVALYFALLRVGNLEVRLPVSPTKATKISPPVTSRGIQNGLASQSMLYRMLLDDGNKEPFSHQLDEQYTILLSRPPGSNFILDAKLGLGNRMRALSTAATIASQCNRSLVLVWEKDEHMGAFFQELFKRPRQLVAVFNFFNPRMLVHPRFKVYNYMDWEPTGRKNTPIKCPPGHDVYVKSAYSLLVPGSHDFDLFHPHQSVRELMGIFPPRLIKNCVGAHIRMRSISNGDLYNIKGTEARVMTGADQYREACHYSHFIKMMKEKFPQKTCFFISIDMFEHLPAIAKELSPAHKILFLQPSSNAAAADRSKASVQLALANMLLLSQTKYLLTSRWSSFSEMAVKIGSVLNENACLLKSI